MVEEELIKDFLDVLYRNFFQLNQNQTLDQLEEIVDHLIEICVDYDNKILQLKVDD